MSTVPVYVQVQSTTGKWTDAESMILKDAVQMFGDNKKWTEVARVFKAPSCHE